MPACRTPARGATIAELRGTTQLAGIQFEHSLVQRSVQNELVPAGQALGLGISGCSSLGGGLLSGKYRRGEQGHGLNALGGVAFQQQNSAQRAVIADAALAVAAELGVAPARLEVALR